MRLKNGWPWSSIQNTGYTVSQEFINTALSIFNNTDWENFKRPIEQTAIYPHTRVREWEADFPTEIPDPEVEKLSLDAFEDLKNAVPNCRLFHSELVYLAPLGIIPWHHDRRKSHYLGTKIMLLLENEDVDYYFAPWNDQTPSDLGSFKVDPYIDETSIIHARMKVGNFYIFNHRIPHSTINLTNRPRAMLMLEVIDRNIILKDRYHYAPLASEEFDQLAPPVL